MLKRALSFGLVPPSLSAAPPSASWSAIDSQRSAAEASFDATALLGRVPHRHELHLTKVYGFRGNEAGRIFFKNDGLVFHKRK